jgi:glycosyltransferase involved in cell wall biosynthesis
LSPVSLSVVVPTRDRRASLLRCLAALRAQGAPPSALEVLVVDDGSTDGTAEAVTAAPMPFPVRVLRRPHQGAAAARNHGAAAAAGRLLLFLDDDIEAAPSLVAAHIRAHEGPGEHVALGDVPLVPPGPRGYFNEQLRDWGREMIEPLRRPGHRFRHRDLLSGHFSVGASLFVRVGGFDARLRCHEDYELGYRLLRAGARFTFLPDAVGVHHEITDLPRALSRKLQEGIADVQIGRRHPELRPTLLLGRLAGRLSGPHRALAALAFSFPRGGDRTIALACRLLDALEFFRQRWLWRRVLYGPLEYWYWRGVASELGSRGELDRFVGERPAAAGPPALVIDLRDGLEPAEGRLDATTPDGVRLVYGASRVGDVPAVPGAEPLRARHLRPLLARDLARPLRAAIRREGGRPSPAAVRLLERLGTRGSAGIRRRSTR